MRSLVERQRAFASALLDLRQPLPPGLHCASGAQLDARFSVYRNNVAVALIESLRSTFPVVAQLVGAECFAALALPYAQHSPPESAVLLRYGGSFADYLQANEAATGLSYLADVARIEWHWLEAYYAAEATPSSLEQLQAAAGEALPQSALCLHPSIRWLAVEHSAYSIWRAHREPTHEAVLQVNDAREHVLILRPHADVIDHAAAPEMLVLLQALAVGHSLMGAAEAVLAAMPQADLGALFHHLFESGAVIGTREPCIHAD